MKLIGISKLTALIGIGNSEISSAVAALNAELAEAKFESAVQFLDRYPMTTVEGPHMKIPLADDYYLKLIINFAAGMIFIDGAVSRHSAQPRRNKNARAA